MDKIYLDPSQPLEARVDDLMRCLTLEEKVSLMAGATSFELPAIERLGVPALAMSDGPTGVRSQEGVPATVFPVGIALAATWDPELAARVGAAIAREARALGKHVLLAPTINIIRTPIWGRNFETYSEDPWLTAKIAAAYVNGVQGEGVGTSLKHFALNNQEHNRFRVSAEIDERTLREIYLFAFETVVREARPWTVMASYNRVNGFYATESRALLTGILKREWNYDGVVVSDWGAVHSTAPSVNAGTDLEMPGPARHYGARLIQALQEWSVSEAQIDDSARRLVRLILRAGLLDGATAAAGEIAGERHRQIALEAARDSLVLLKNDGGLLPFDPASLKSVAVIGPNGDSSRVQGGGSSHVRPASRITPLAAIRALLGPAIAVSFAQGVDHEPVPPPAQPRFFSPTRERAGEGLTVEYYDDAEFSRPIAGEVERRFTKRMDGAEPGPAATARAIRWRGVFWPPRDGRYEFSVLGAGTAELELAGRSLIDANTPASSDPRDILGISIDRRTAAIDLKGGAGVPLRLEYTKAGAAVEIVSLGVRVPSGTIDEACAAARAADAVILMVGSSSVTESEGYDRENLDLPGRQNELIEAVLAANPRTAIVVNAGAPISMPWISRARAVLAAWLPGQEGPRAIADALFGRCLPSGRLPVTFPLRIEDDPAYIHMPGGRRAFYGEGMFVGYRYYDRKNIGPLFPFGHGLSYTTFTYSDLECPREVALGAPLTISLRVTNTGARAGKETVQLYLSALAPPEPGPVKALKGFQKATLAPGENRRVSLTLTAREFSYYDVDLRRWAVAPGAYEILIGASSRDIRLSATVNVAGGPSADSST